MRGRAARAAAALVLAAGLAAVPATAASAAAYPAGGDTLGAARAATAHYLDGADVPSPYVAFLPCFESSAGGMGQHFVDGAAIADPAEDATHPEALVYAETANGYRLVALEYIVPAGKVDPSNPPRLFGQDFHAETVPGAGDLYVLHAWVWSHNPAGTFEDWNPRVDSCR